jgi:hypothetical protein
MTELEMHKADLEILERSLKFHKDRLPNFGKPTGRKAIHPFDHIHPSNLIFHLEKNINWIKGEIARKGKSKKKA